VNEGYWKVLNKDRTAFHGGQGKWPAPKRWLEVKGPLVPCQHGLHVCRQQDLVHWLGPTIWEVEVEGEQVVAENKVVVRRARLVQQLRTWNEKNARLFACDCAEAVLPLYEKYNESKAPHNAIAVARKFAAGKATREELDAARDAAGAAARAAQSKLLFSYLYPKGLLK
jgi:hypothetical protein